MIIPIHAARLCFSVLLPSLFHYRHFLVDGFVTVAFRSVHNHILFVPFSPRHTRRAKSRDLNTESDDDDTDWTPVKINEVLDSETNGLDDDDWLPDRERVRQQKAKARIYAEKVSPSPYTEDEEEVIAAMGGKTRQAPREQGFLGDSTLQEICTDYSVPICYIADVLCMWRTEPPIHMHDRLGDLVTGEQAFALLEAVNSLDVAALQDRYSNQSLWQVCQEWEIDLAQGFQMAMTEGWSLPFGVHTNLRVEQENELIRVLGNPLAMTRGTDDDDDEDYDWDDDD
ncbi:hypothetical protein FisN_19Lh045 [Fistulifera solaris]|uniref:Uncharacterized protein n=1 Tax=Fistulifera solaris TaxID=1519565 RepID=A0A1Z5JR16_FISSO|nr:hypothetical protein FisN_19Lh045 [Fistulifera solaris]|eukprot:GAX16465.1 hypothetical protein FisN_19Lh045 [Fistulifera solaris]